MNPTLTVLDNLKLRSASGLFFGFYDKCYFQQAVFVNLSRRV